MALKVTHSSSSALCHPSPWTPLSQVPLWSSCPMETLPQASSPSCTSASPTPPPHAPPSRPSCLPLLPSLPSVLLLVPFFWNPLLLFLPLNLPALVHLKLNPLQILTDPEFYMCPWTKAELWGIVKKLPKVTEDLTSLLRYLILFRPISLGFLI